MASMLLRGRVLLSSARPLLTQPCALSVGSQLLYSGDGNTNKRVLLSAFPVSSQVPVEMPHCSYAQARVGGQRREFSSLWPSVTSPSLFSGSATFSAKPTSSSGKKNDGTAVYVRTYASQQVPLLYLSVSSFNLWIYIYFLFLFVWACVGNPRTRSW